MPKQRVLKNRTDEQGKPQQQKQDVEKVEQQNQSPSTNQLQQQPPRKITQTVKKGPPKEYRYMTTVKSFEELDEFRFQNYCQFGGDRRRHTFMTITMPCTRKKTGKNCHFELKAFRCSDSGNIHVYAFAEHNHTLESNVQRLLCTVEKELVPDGNPPPIFRTLDSIEWTFLQTLPDYDTFDKFRRQNNCNCRGTASDRSSRIRCYCAHSHNYNCKDDCQFMLLAVKTTKRRFHVYSYGEHNHSLHKIKKMQKLVHGKQKSRQEQMEDEDGEGEVPMEEEQDEQMETEGQGYPLEKCQRRLQSNLRKDNKERTKKWMGRIDRADIGQVIAEMDVENVAKLLRIADIDICDCEASLEVWLPWIKKAIRKRGAELVEFIMKFKHLRKIKSLPNKLKGKIGKMLEQRRSEIEEAQKMVPEETSSDDEN